MSEEKKTPQELNSEELNRVAGGQGGNDLIHDLSRFVQRTVCNVIHYHDTACLTMSRSPNGSIIEGIGWQNGEPILVHGSYKEDGWYFAYKNGKFGYVCPDNVR